MQLGSNDDLERRGEWLWIAAVAVMMVMAASARADPVAGGDATLEAERLAVEHTYWKSVQENGTAAGYEAYLAKYPKGEFTALAQMRLDKRAESTRPGRFRDDLASGGRGPQMVVLPAGTFGMGCVSGRGCDGDEKPVREVTIPAPFAIGVYEVTRGQFGRFVDETGYLAGESCLTYEDGEGESRAGRGWRDPGFRQTDAHPAVCVSWEDARAYVEWLSRETGGSYRLPSESEWEYAARAGTTTARHWGESASAQCRHANGADASTDFGWATDCDDGHSRTAPAGSFASNGFGLYDALGNVWEWTADCWNDGYAGAPTDGRARETGDCMRRVLRGGSWSDFPWYLRSANRFRVTTGFRSSSDGFRVARTLAP